ncbi:hypothetical protein E0486_06105 [Flaviaesturariibacter aridisoli]|uniref:Bacterial surface antigen (D15) domain-containing protein n=1 Tax=Flaviaesturariibacter aridisoli TaxID=2545761 RepID=A0A4R4E2B4_9BACT|nr:hypothetical protein E0486_06105 [Flaviaesturariibacter aridisoli]
MRAVVAVLICVVFPFLGQAQVNTVEYGKNRVQYKKFKWKYYQTENFNTYFSQNGLELGKYVAQIAEKELPQLEEFVEYGMQRRANVVVYNNFDDLQQSNIGQGIDWQSTGGLTKLVNNKMVVYYDANRNNLRRQVRQGIAQVLVQNLLFGDDLGEFAANQALLDLPKWLTDGYIAYAAEPWSTELDEQLKNAMLGGSYNNFYQFAFEKPELAGHAFWYYVGNKYGATKPTYLLYLARIYRNLNSATQKIAKKKFKEVLRDFMQEMPNIYYKDIRGRRVVPKGQLSVTEEVGKKDFIRFNANPLPRSFTYAVTEYKQGKYSVVLHENFVNTKTLLSYGHRSREDEINPNMPILAWDNKGTRLAVVYVEKGKLKFFVYDVVNRIKISKQEWSQFDQVQDIKYMLNSNTLVVSAVRSGQSDIYTYNIDKMTYEQVTNDVFDDLDPSFVTFPNKTGIVFASNRPSANAAGGDTAMPGPRFNIFLVDNWNKSEFKQISQLTNLKFGNARNPSPYNNTHFTFTSDENGINNRYAGFFTTQKTGIDTLVFIGDEVMRNPAPKEVDSLLKEWKKTDIDSVGYFATSSDSAYVFPLTNYQAGLIETRTAGDNTLVSEVVQQGEYKNLYRLRVDENTLRRRNVSTPPTEYVRKLRERDRLRTTETNTMTNAVDSTRKTQTDFFQSEFNDKRDSANAAAQPTTTPGQVFETEVIAPEPVLSRAKLYEYRPPRFFTDYVAAGFNNAVLAAAKYQQYTGGTGPINPSNGSQINGLIRMGTVDLFEDYKISGGFRIAPNLRDNDILFEFTNYRRRLDWGFTYYRSSARADVGVILADTSGNFFQVGFPGKTHSNYYLGRLRFALDKVRSLRLTVGPRFDRVIVSTTPEPGFNRLSLLIPDQKQVFGQATIEYVHDNTLNPATNIWTGLRYKVYFDYFSRLDKGGQAFGRTMMNAGFDARHYQPLYRNVIWALRAAGDFSFAEQKVVYYLGGVDGWLKFKSNEIIDPNTQQVTGYRYFNADPANAPDQSQFYAYQTLAVNMRGFKQNIANGNNNVVINSEFRAPIFSTFFNRPINNAFLRNLQAVQFFDLGTAWTGDVSNIARPTSTYSDPSGINPITVRLKAGGIGPFAGGYGFGLRSTLLGYFIRWDIAWEMNGFFRGKPMSYFALGLDF